MVSTDPVGYPSKGNGIGCVHKSYTLIYTLLKDSVIEVGIITNIRMWSCYLLDIWCSGQSFWKCSTEPHTRQHPPKATKAKQCKQNQQQCCLMCLSVVLPAAYSPLGLSGQDLDKWPVWPQIKHLAYGNSPWKQNHSNRNVNELDAEISFWIVVHLYWLIQGLLPMAGSTLARHLLSSCSVEPHR